MYNDIYIFIQTHKYVFKYNLCQHLIYILYDTSLLLFA